MQIETKQASWFHDLRGTSLASPFNGSIVKKFCLWDSSRCDKMWGQPLALLCRLTEYRRECRMNKMTGSTNNSVRTSRGQLHPLLVIHRLVSCPPSTDLSVRIGEREQRWSATSDFLLPTVYNSTRESVINPETRYSVEIGSLPSQPRNRDVAILSSGRPIITFTEIGKLSLWRENLDARGRFYTWSHWIFLIS